ncbi:hypothetical protein OF829_11925 [Sphingomonas sp. LB-2]|uniref:hypothetical protein n=1 Tax=Sphingomonas caeni TaxID=2984949 RepID=UPI00222E4DA2|nr:hypothetical protein [Sphingomonas caeni]MCW3847949.1 hypothetical protein [Sphingomonas caeni]
MTRLPVLADGIAALLAATGLALLVRPGAMRALLRLPEGEAAAYGLRIGGAMLFAAALFLGGFATAWWLAR